MPCTARKLCSARSAVIGFSSARLAPSSNALRTLVTPLMMAKVVEVLLEGIWRTLRKISTAPWTSSQSMITASHLRRASCSAAVSGPLQTSASIARSLRTRRRMRITASSRLSSSDCSAISLSQTRWPLRKLDCMPCHNDSSCATGYHRVPLAGCGAKRETTQNVRKTVYLSLGSNVGDRPSNLRDALARLAGLGEVTAVSSYYETEPVDFLAQPWFLNCVVAVSTDKMPRQFLGALQKIEQEMGRKRTQPKG